MDIIKRFTEILTKSFSKSIQPNDIGYESVSLTHEEIDTNLVPENLIPTLPKPAICHFANYEDAFGDYYIFIQIEKANKERYETLLVNDKVVLTFNEGAE